MASKKGKIVTIIILVAITLGSFIFWVVPEDNKATFSISDYENYLDGVKNIHGVLDEGVDLRFQGLLDGKVSAEEYIRDMEITSSQVTEQISELVISRPSEEWQESYINYMEALRKFNSQIKETIVLAEIMNNKDYSEEEYEKTLQKINEMDSEINQSVILSDQTRP